MRDLAIDERLRDHADDLAARRERGVGERAHQPDARPAVDEPEALRGERAAQPVRRLRVVGVRTEARAGEDAELFTLPHDAGQPLSTRRPCRRAFPLTSSRPTTSAASTATQIDGDVAEQVGRAFARVLGDLRGKPTSALRIGLGRDMRLTAPELAARYRDGMVAEGATVLDAGMVGTEMLYFLVGSRELDGGLMCTASHNPKAYTGAKLVREGALALSGDAGIGDIRDARASPGCPRRTGRAGRAWRRSTWPRSSAPARSRSSTPAAIRPLKVVLDGGNGMAGPDGRARSSKRSTASSWSPPTGSPTARSPTTSPTRCCPRTAGS